MAFMKKFRFLMILILLPAVYLLACTPSQSHTLIHKNTVFKNFIYEMVCASVAEQNNPVLLKPLIQSLLKDLKNKLTQNQLYSQVTFIKTLLNSPEMKNSYISPVRESGHEFHALDTKELVHAIKPLSSEMVYSQVHNI